MRLDSTARPISPAGMSNRAPGGPGAPSTYARGRKQALGTSASASAKLWFTLADGNLSEVFYPRIDRPVLRELRFLVAAPGAPPIDDAREARHQVSWLRPGLPAYIVRSTHLEYTLSTEFIADAELSAVLISGTFEPSLPDVSLYIHASLHVLPDSAGNSASVIDVEPPVLVAQQEDVWTAIVGPFAQASVGFLNSSDIFVELDDSEGQLAHTYAHAVEGNVALGARIGLPAGPFQVAVGFARSAADAEDAARRIREQGVNQTRLEFERRWYEVSDLPRELERVASDEGALARASLTILRSLEDKSQRGAFVAAPGAPWGENQETGGHAYHLVWPRDLFHIATALLVAGDSEAAVRALGHLQRTQRPDGSWPQNWWLDGAEHWRGLELDQVAYPILLAWRLALAGAVGQGVYQSLIRRAAAFIVRQGPSTPLDRWEDAGGLSPATLGSCIAALAAAEEFAYDAGDHLAAVHMRGVADYWADRLEAWCFDEERGCYVRLAKDPDSGARGTEPVSVDFLELVRLGLRSPDDPHVTQSLQHVDSLLRCETPRGVAWRRYVGDEYGEHPDGSPWDGSGYGRAWPLLAGERARHSLGMGSGAAEGLAALEAFAGPELVLPEQVWEATAIPERDLYPGLPSNSVAPLGWAHAEYLKLLASVAAGVSVDEVEPAASRYRATGRGSPAFIWSHNHQITTFLAGRSVKVQLPFEALVRWTADGWASRNVVETHDTNLGVWVAELPTEIMRPGAMMEWTAEYAGHREGRNYSLVCVVESKGKERGAARSR